MRQLKATNKKNKNVFSLTGLCKSDRRYKPEVMEINIKIHFIIQTNIPQSGYQVLNSSKPPVVHQMGVIINSINVKKAAKDKKIV